MHSSVHPTETSTVSSTSKAFGTWQRNYTASRSDILKNKHFFCQHEDVTPFQDCLSGLHKSSFRENMVNTSDEFALNHSWSSQGSQDNNKSVRNVPR